MLGEVWPLIAVSRCYFACLRILLRSVTPGSLGHVGSIHHRHACTAIPVWELIRTDMYFTLRSISLKPQESYCLDLLQAAMAVLGNGPDCEIFSDELNHASIIDGVRLAKQTGASVKVYRHNDMHHLRQMMQNSSPRKRKLVITDSLFSMDGGKTPLLQTPCSRTKLPSWTPSKHSLL